MENKPKFRPSPPPALKLMDQVREGRCCVITIMRTAPSNLTASGYCVISACLNPLIYLEAIFYNKQSKFVALKNPYGARGQFMDVTDQ